MKFSSIEIRDLLKAWIAISLAFAIIMNKSIPLDVLPNKNFFLILIISAFTVGIGFLLHELSHKYLAQKYNCFAEFRSFDIMLILAIIFSFFGFIFAAPGAVMISGRITKEKNGKISMMGPLSNLIIAFIFLLLSFIITSNLFLLITNYGVMINSWLALFNLIPFWNFDGAKIFHWNKLVYFALVIIAIIFISII